MLKLETRRQKLLGLLLIVAGTLLPSNESPAATFQQFGNTLVMSNGNVRLEYNLIAGTTDFFWRNARKITCFYRGVTLSPGYIRSIDYSSRSSIINGSTQAVVPATGAGRPTMKQTFTLTETNSFLTRLTVEGQVLNANWIAPMVVDSTGGVDLGVAKDNRALCVPFDNDHFVRYDAKPINNTAIESMPWLLYALAPATGFALSRRAAEPAASPPSCGSIEWCDIWILHANKTNLPRALLLWANTTPLGMVKG